MVQAGPECHICTCGLYAGLKKPMKNIDKHILNEKFLFLIGHDL